MKSVAILGNSRGSGSCFFARWHQDSRLSAAFLASGRRSRRMCGAIGSAPMPEVQQGEAFIGYLEETSDGFVQAFGNWQDSGFFRQWSGGAGTMDC